VGFTRWLVLLRLCDLGPKPDQRLQQLRPYPGGDVARGICGLKGLALSGFDLAQTLLELCGRQRLRTLDVQMGQISPKGLMVDAVLVDPAPELL
jgi:hypothetical protein